ncbi:MAG: ComEC/Rec2 family competence protein [Candidatus Paceibacterota bacterium]|jgi:competence protein ComEC
MTRSELFLVLCGAFISGVLLGSYCFVEIWLLIFYSGIAAMLFFIFRKGNAAKLSLVILIILAGAVSIEMRVKNDEAAVKLNGFEEGRKIKIEGRMAHIGTAKNSDQEIVLDSLKNSASGSAIPGKIIVYLPHYPAYKACSAIVIEGKINMPSNFSGFDYRMYLASKGIYYTMYYPKIESVKNTTDLLCGYSAGIRDFASELNKKIYPQPQSAIMNALILGIESDISEEVINAFNKTGTRHLLAISGFNISIIAIILMSLLLSLGIRRDRAFYFSSIGIILYVMIIESSSSSIRAGIMGELVLVAFKLGRLPSALNAIVFAASAMLLENPYLLRYDVGFQLSFLAVMGLMFIYPKFDKHLSGIRDIFGMKTIFMATISAQIAALPILLYNFGNVSVLSVVSNMLVLPFAIAVMIGGFAIIFIGTFSLYLARVLSWPIWLLIEYQVETIKYISKIDLFAIRYDDPNYLFVPAYYMILIGLLRGKTFLNSIMSGNANNKKIPKP